MRIEDLEDSQRLQLLIEGVIDYAIYILDLDGHIVSWNSGAARLKGYTADEIVGQRFHRFFTDEDRKSGFPDRALEEARTHGRFESEGWRVRKDGSKFWALAVMDAIRDRDGAIIGFAKITRDMTQRREAQLALETARDQLAASQRLEAIGQLSGGIAHDFNNLLMIIQGNLETVDRALKNPTGFNPANVQRSVANAMRGAERASALTHRLLAFSRRQALDPKPLDVNRFITHMVEFLQRTLGETVDVEAVGAAGLWEIEVDLPQLEAAMINLAINARDAMPDGGKLTIEALNTYLDQDYCHQHPEVTPGQYVLICVTDTGLGMEQDVIARAFEPFFTTKEVGHGTGLGLSQVYGFVKQSHGHIRIYSEPSQGTTIKVYLPRRRHADHETSSDDVDSEETPAGGERGECILVVEDDIDVRNYVVQTLRELNYRVTGVANAHAALSVLRSEDRVDLMLTDVVMRGLNGRELAEQAKNLRPGMPILFMTGYSRNAIIHQGRIDNGIDLLQKPISQAQLSNRIRELLDKSANSTF
jgi:PAS domain S-box-containing protein